METVPFEIEEGAGDAAMITRTEGGVFRGGDVNAAACERKVKGGFNDSRASFHDSSGAEDVPSEASC